ncbi:YtxH domain-containing protein [Flavihumibacter sp. RY-1]|uniref:YtxH domain-containing protein n=1 Tax=Flavihumibacter fluminis TaxID=2909236 RepID=A0ABS9BHY3_9BACT|nr:YtxH domain-containing protein [Flavihumibacter fluminis]MCF1714459.1 YtxH domain-containing protein [Flavihumibacter fluminis]
MTNTNKILTALATGVIVGGVLGVLFAPDKGENTRNKIAEGGKKLSDSIKDKMNQGKEKLAGMRNTIRDRVEEFSS